MVSQLLWMGAALFLVALNGFFVAAEFGLVKLRPTKVKAMATTHGIRGRVLAKVHGQLDAYLSACQLGITLASLGLGWVGEPAFAGLLAPLFDWVGVDDPDTIHGISLAVAFAVISFLHIVVGELAPKSMSIRRPEQIGLWVAIPLYGFYWLMYPGIWLLNHSANWVLRCSGLDPKHSHDSSYSTEELKLILKSNRGNGLFTPNEWKVLEHSLGFGKLTVSDLMRPFSEVVSLSAARSSSENMAIAAQHRYSRYPYVDEEGHVLGVVHLKNLFVSLQRGLNLDDYELPVLPAMQVPPDLPAITLFRRFREGTAHFAIVRYKEQPPLGFVTLDNLLAAMVGEIRDEFHAGQQQWVQQPDGQLWGRGSLPIITLAQALGVEIHNDQVDSVGGLVMWKLGNVPQPGQRVSFEWFDIVIKTMKGPRILELSVIPKDGLLLADKQQGRA